MTETFTALLFAHVLADFVFQTKSMVQGKSNRSPGPLALHIAIVLVLSIVALGTWHPMLAVVAGAHLLIDLAKTFAPRARLWPFLADQGAHLFTLGAAAALAPDLWHGGLWSVHDWVAGTMALAAGFVLATRAGGFAVGLLLAPYAGVALPEGLKNGGVLIGLLERGLIFILVLAGQPGGIGFLVAAKSILRYETTTRDQRAGEYVIIGTLASFGWSMAVAWATLALLAALPPIGILPETP